MTEDKICKQFSNPFHRLVVATMDVQKLCGIAGVPMDNIIAISNEYGIEIGELLNHLDVLGYKVVEGSIVKCPSS